MGLDKRLIAILFHNGINDVTRVEKYLGRKDDYLEVIIDGQLEKLKIPGIIYPEDIPSVEYLESKIKETEKNKLDSVTNNLEDVVETVSEICVGDVRLDRTLKEIKDSSFEEELKKTELENQKVLKSIKEKTKTEKKSVKKKIKNIETKEVDDNIDDFIDSI